MKFPLLVLKCLITKLLIFYFRLNKMCIFTILVIFFVTIFYFYSVYNHDYWKSRNVKYIKPLPFFLSYFFKIFRMTTFTETINGIYNAYPEEKIIGFYQGSQPSLVIKDPELIKYINVVDFNYFNFRDIEKNSDEQLNTNLFHATGESWRFLRQKLTAAFSHRKLQRMFPHIITCSGRLQELGHRVVSRGGDVDAYHMMSRYTMEFIATCGMGIDIDIILDENCVFFNFSIKAFKRSTFQIIRIMLNDISPKWLQLSYFIDPKVKRFLNELSYNICKSRSFKPSTRNDFVDFMLEMQSENTKDEFEQKNSPDKSPFVLDMSNPKVIAEQVSMFFVAGFETTASSTSFTLHQLAYHTKIQRKIQNQIDNILSEYENKLCYEALTKMTYLEMAFLEAMRILPPAGLLKRKCMKEYTLPGTNVTIDPGVSLVVPIQAIHMDEKYYPNPHEFNPERFAPHVVEGFNKFVYMAFGSGKRTCIGRRLGILQSMAGLAAVLQKFNVEPAPTSCKDVKPNRKCQFVQNLEKVPIKLVARKSTLV